MQEMAGGGRGACGVHSPNPVEGYEYPGLVCETDDAPDCGTTSAVCVNASSRVGLQSHETGIAWGKRLRDQQGLVPTRHIPAEIIGSSCPDSTRG